MRQENSGRHFNQIIRPATKLYAANVQMYYNKKSGSLPTRS